MRALVIFLALALLCACSGGKERLPQSVGAPDEVLVVMPKGHWEGQPGAAVRAALEQPLQGLPQREELFRVAQCRPQDFASLLKGHHSVVMADIGGDTSVFRIRHDVNAHGQLMVQVSAATPMEWIALWRAHADEAIDALEKHQRARIGDRLVRERDEALSAQVRERLGVELDIPGGYHVMRLDSSFAWLERDRLMTGSGLEHNVIEGILIHAHPYASDSTWNVPYLVGLRDSLTATRVPGPNHGSYMIVQRGFEGMDLMPTARAVDLNGRFAYFMRGLYGMHGAKMGGPFVSLTTVDPTGSRIITVEGFAYAPQFDKRPYVRELEALLFSLRFRAQ